tara:strand:+ start:672 stop:1451 length:780 start_codon:yes stop_codon:yes gene_type:complete
MLPIANNYTLLDSAVVECAYAGCDTIWIVCNDDTAPLLRHRVGDYIEDPAYYYYNTSRNIDHRKRIPIFWIPQHPKDRDKRDCLSWSVVYGSLVAFKTSSKISKWTIPDKYYVSFPYGLSNPRHVMKSRRLYRTKNNFYMTNNNCTVQDNIHTSFTFGKEEFIRYRKNVRKGTGRFKGDYKNMVTLPVEQQWSARFFELKDVFNCLNLENSNLVEAEHFFNIASWQDYQNYMKSDYSDIIEKPPKEMFSYKEFNRVAAN